MKEVQKPVPKPFHIYTYLSGSELDRIFDVTVSDASMLEPVRELLDEFGKAEILKSKNRIVRLWILRTYDNVESVDRWLKQELTKLTSGGTPDPQIEGVA